MACEHLLVFKHPTMASSPGLIFFFTRSLAAHFGCKGLYFPAGSLYARSFLLPPVLSISSSSSSSSSFPTRSKEESTFLLLLLLLPSPFPLTFPSLSFFLPASNGDHGSGAFKHLNLANSIVLAGSSGPRYALAPCPKSRSMFSMIASGKLFSSYSFFRFVDVIPSSSSSSSPPSLSFVVFLISSSIFFFSSLNSSNRSDNFSDFTPSKSLMIPMFESSLKLLLPLLLFLLLVVEEV